MNKTWYKDFIGVYEGAFSNEYCEHIISQGNQNIAKLGFSRQSKSGGGKYPISQQDTSIGMYGLLEGEEMKNFFDPMREAWKLYSHKYSILPSVTSYNKNFLFVDCKWQKTSPSEGFHEWHCENLPIFPFNLRFLVWTLYLNDIEEGGETEFLYQSFRLKPKQGTLCLFPAGFTHTHRGNPPLKKDKYIATGWMEHAYIKNSNMKHPIAPADLDPKKQ